MYKVTFETPAGLRGPVKKVPLSYEGDIHFASAMAESIFEVLKNFAALNTPNRIFEYRKRPIPTGFVLEIYLTNTNPYKRDSGSLYGYIRCEELSGDERRENTSLDR